MNQEHLELWLHDLETTKDPQAEGALTSIDAGDCCLGRLCKVAIANGVPITVAAGRRYVTYDNAIDMPPSSVQEWLGHSGSLYAAAAEMNDTEGLTFKEIAERIRKEFA